MASYEYAVRYMEKGATGHDFAEWSCGCPRLYRTFGEAEEIARNWREDAAEGVCDYMMDIEVVRRPVLEWEPVRCPECGEMPNVDGDCVCDFNEKVHHFARVHKRWPTDAEIDAWVARPKEN